MCVYRFLRTRRFHLLIVSTNRVCQFLLRWSAGVRSCAGVQEHTSLKAVQVQRKAIFSFWIFCVVKLLFSSLRDPNIASFRDLDCVGREEACVHPLRSPQSVVNFTFPKVTLGLCFTIRHNPVPCSSKLISTA